MPSAWEFFAVFWALALFFFVCAFAIGCLVSSLFRLVFRRPLGLCHAGAWTYDGGRDHSFDARLGHRDRPGRHCDGRRGDKADEDGR